MFFHIHWYATSVCENTLPFQFQFLGCVAKLMRRTYHVFGKHMSGKSLRQTLEVLNPENILYV